MFSILLSCSPYTLYTDQFQFTGHSLHLSDNVLHDWLFPHHCIQVRGGMKVAKQHLKLCRQKRKNIAGFARVFSNDALTLIGYRMPPKLDYCFITSTSLVPVAVSTWIHHRWTEKWDRRANNTASAFLEHTHIIDHTFRLHSAH